MESPSSSNSGHLPRERLRLRRWAMASSFYWIGAPFALYGWQRGQMAALAAHLFVGIALVGNLLLYWLLKTGRNMEYRDPSLTVPQMLLAMSTTLIIVGGANEWLRPTVSIGLLAPLLFGCFQLDPKSFLRMALLAIGGYGATLLFIAITRGLTRPVVELTHWIGLSLMLLAMVAICAEIARVRDRQRELGRQLKEAADRDPLTNCFNRRWLNSRLPQAIAQAHRYNRPCSICMIDIDHFKHINDRYGHLTGDAALIWVADQIQSLLRKADSLVRIGGEEFLLLLPETDDNGAMELAERVCQYQAEGRFDRLGTVSLQVTLSIGVAPLLPGDSPDGVMKRADAALYIAKQQGRNRVIRAEPGMEHP